MVRNRVPTLEAKYGITAEDYESLMEVQEGVCAICGQEEERKREDGTAFPLCVDHSHKDNGRVALLLCARCNMGLGLFREDPAILEKAAEYLRLHKPNG